MSGNLQSLKAQLAYLTDELARMPAFKAGTPWHRDRVEECRWLTKAIDRMEGRDPARN